MDAVVAIRPRGAMPRNPFREDRFGTKYRLFPSFAQVKAPYWSPGVEFDYRVSVLPSERWLSRAIFAALTLLPFVLLSVDGEGVLRVVGWTLHTGVVVDLSQVGPAVSIFGLSGVLAILAFIRPVWVNRLWYLLPLMLNLWLLGSTL